MADETNEEPDSSLVEFAAEVRQVGAEIVATVEQGRFEQAKALALQPATAVPARSWR